MMVSMSAECLSFGLCASSVVLSKTCMVRFNLHLDVCVEAATTVLNDACSNECSACGTVGCLGSLCQGHIE